MTDRDRADERLKDHARQMQPFWEGLDSLGVTTPDAASDPFQLPYTSTPDMPHSDFKLTFPA